ncbi:S8 family serine peptidase [Tumebacillus flagellatus]|uniref:Peptidase S8/S53 domain-containing protein n=1 Tax=Tumebacillus flagellatus TaxID=1157490 RepID=A0A074MHW1_9BACL|nr:S8 family serine peptidase [Tumebacillus flagellatus]KEO85277.1 hypothetical protein EL26_01585 [Tumebacillus flagellatus]
MKVSKGCFRFLLVAITCFLSGCNYSDLKGVTAEGQLVRDYVGLSTSNFQSLTGNGVTVAVIDSGIQPSENISRAKIKAFRDFVNNKSEPYDDNGHGTFIANIIAGNNQMHGLSPDVNLISLKVLDEDLQADSSSLKEALQWIYENRKVYSINIVNISIGIPDHQSDDKTELARWIHLLRTAGILIVCSAGNNGPDENTIMVPATFDDVLTVGSVLSNGTLTPDDDRITSFSSRGSGAISKPDLVTLGVNIRSFDNKEKFVTKSGTSFSAAIVTGVVADLMEKFKDKNADYVEEYLKNATYPLKVPRKEQGQGELKLR